VAEVCKHCFVTVTNKVGKLAEVTDKIKDAGLNIMALCAWTEGDQGKMVVIADDNEKCCTAMQPAVDSCEFAEAVCVSLPNKPGALNAAAHKLADAGINIEMIYATAGKAAEATIVLKTSDDAKAAGLL
jgi:hypothetical protein